MVKPAKWLHRRLQRVFAGMAKGRVPDIMRQTYCLCEVFIQPERAGNSATNLCDFKAVCQADTIMVAVG